MVGLSLVIPLGSPIEPPNHVTTIDISSGYLTGMILFMSLGKPLGSLLDGTSIGAVLVLALGNSFKNPIGYLLSSSVDFLLRTPIGILMGPLPVNYMGS